MRRFDRTDDQYQVHFEDFAQIFGVYPEKKYQHASYRNIAEVIQTEIGDTGSQEFIRRLVFNTLIGNADMHLKNWALIYPDQHHAAMAPGYDFVSTIPYIKDASMALSFVKTKTMTALSLDLLQAFAAKAKLPQKMVVDTATETVERFAAAWHQEIPNLPLPKSTQTIIKAFIPQIKLVQELKMDL